MVARFFFKCSPVACLQVSSAKCEDANGNQAINFVIFNPISQHFHNVL